ncbi:hypothetical protein [Xenorhabdus szentirmaii]|uniref:hypothetical protein n=1 Tax=Xenorhabdus szentirmaii TaxID=290112 RepID=UPI0019C9B3E7|nr:MULTISPECIES: hypothetical protein [unclassified Xenorhabdus]MBD2793377.1 hypothetical protein [Xenorhabdus sp. CUL]MBD2825811.1 hypothetical protein [Xenorhabdus sp. 5]
MDISNTSARRWLLLLTVCLTGVLVPLCFTGPAIMLPSIQQILGEHHQISSTG